MTKLKQLSTYLNGPGVIPLVLINIIGFSGGIGAFLLIALIAYAIGAF